MTDTPPFARNLIRYGSNPATRRQTLHKVREADNYFNVTAECGAEFTIRDGGRDLFDSIHGFDPRWRCGRCFA